MARRWYRKPKGNKTPSSQRRNNTARSATHGSRASTAPSTRSSSAFAGPTLQEYDPRSASTRQPSSARGSSVSRSSFARSTARTQQNSPEPPDKDSDDLHEVIMAVDMRDRGTVGCCYYVARTEKLHLMEDVKFGSADVVDMLKLFINPTLVLVGSTIDESVLNGLDPEQRARGQDDVSSDAFNSPYLLDLRPYSEFNNEAAKNKLLNLRIDHDNGPQIVFVVPGDVHAIDESNPDDEDGFAWRQSQFLRLSGWINLESSLSVKFLASWLDCYANSSEVGCAGAVLSHLQRRRAARYLPGDGAAQLFFRVSTIEMFTLKETMFINSDTLVSLQIMQSESHPHAHNQGPKAAGSKEGLSLYGLFHHLARTPQGKYLLRQYFLRPSLNVDLINERLATIAVFLRPENDAPFMGIVKNLKSVVNVRTLMINLRKGISAGSGKASGIAKGTWKGLQKFTYHAIGIQRALDEVIGAERLAISAKIKTRFHGYHLAQIGRLITETVDFDESLQQHRTVVKHGVSEELDEQKRLYEGISDLLSEVARDIAGNVPAGLVDNLNVIYFPQIGFLIAMPMDPEIGRALWEGDGEDAWERMFSSDTIVYYKNYQMTEMDEWFGDIYGEICDREIEIIYELAQRVLEFEDMLSTASDVCGELDCLLALAQGAKQYKFSRPHISPANIIDIKGGRHPLQELTVPSYVPNDTFLVGGDDNVHTNDAFSSLPHPTSTTASPSNPTGPSMLLLTGANYSGKSIHLKQAALIVYLAHIGSYVPATSARIGLTDKILTRIATRESVSKPQSAFMIDLQQVSLALNLATRRSLLVIDEFGKGTRSVDGAGLACAVFTHLAALGTAAPKVLAATHFHEIFGDERNGFLAPASTPALQLGHMEIRVAADARGAEEPVAYLYNFRPGRSLASFGTCCAAMNGVAGDVVRRAEGLMALMAAGEDLVAACAVMTGDEAGALQDAERVARAFLLAGDVEGDPREVLDRVLGIA